MRKNVIVGQSGGASAVFNATLAGVYHMADDLQTNVYGMMNGLQGLLEDKIVNLGDYIRNQYDLEVLRNTPGAFLGSCRYTLPDYNEQPEVYNRIFDVLRKHDISSFYYIGGLESLKTLNKLCTYAKIIGCDDIRFIGIPKTIDNDIPLTDHTPGFASAAKYVATSVKELIRDSSIYGRDFVTVVEVMGRDTGWLTAATTLCKGSDCSGPDLVYLPEKVFDPEKALEDIARVRKNKKSVIVCIGEGCKLADGRYLCDVDESNSFTEDASGKRLLTGASRVFARMIHDRFNCRVRAVEFSALQRSACHMASKTDNDEAFTIGENAVKASNLKHTGEIVIINRVSNDPYQIRISVKDIKGVFNESKSVPTEWILDDNSGMTKEFEQYARPLIQGSVVTHYKDGLPLHMPLISM